MASLDLEKEKEKTETRKMKETGGNWWRGRGWIMQIRAQLQLERGELTGESSLVERERGYGSLKGFDEIRA